MLALYPEIEPYQTHLLERETLSSGKKHEIYVEECGNPDGIPVVFLHGGPGSGCRPQHRQYFDPEKYRIVLFDQRGCGRSKPSGELEMLPQSPAYQAFHRYACGLESQNQTYAVCPTYAPRRYRLLTYLLVHLLQEYLESVAPLE